MTPLAATESSKDLSPGEGGALPKTPDLDLLLDEAKISAKTLRDAIKGLVVDDDATLFAGYASEDDLFNDLDDVPKAARRTISGNFFKALVANGIVTPPPAYVPASRTARCRR